MDRRRKYRKFKLQAAPLVFAAIIGLGIGLVIGWLAKTSVKPLTDYEQQLLNISQQLARDAFHQDADTMIPKIINAVDLKHIKRSLETIISMPHLSGTSSDEELVEIIYKSWKSHGLDVVETASYEVLASYSDLKKPNTVELISKNSGVTLYQSTLPTLPHQGEWIGHSYPNPYFSYAPNGTVTGEPVFVNYGLPEDYKKLAVEFGINVRGKIVIVKSGQSPCSKKLSLAESHGAIGLLIYPDPINYAREGTGKEDVYPKKWWLPKDGIIRASVLDGAGDPSTPGYPSVDGAFHFQPEKLKLPKIIAQPINYQDAREILGRMKGATVGDEWKGGLDIVYRVGPGFSDEFKDLQLKISCYNKLLSKPVYNLIGTIHGRYEPDRYVLIGNHRDAWVTGAVDPGSGTSVMNELTRIFGSFLAEGWRPKRTIKFCLWGAEEFGLIGSTEWVEEHILELQERAIAYINIDTITIGDTFSPMMSSSLRDAMKTAAKLVPDPNAKDKSLFSTWWNASKAVTSDGSIDFETTSLGLFSDFAPFLFISGVPVMDITWEYNNMSSVFLYPAYHTSYETIDYIENFLDPGFRRHAACAQFSAIMMYLLSDSSFIPFNLTAIVKDVKYYWSYVSDYEDVLLENNISIDGVKVVMQKMELAAKNWEINLEKADKSNPFTVRALNDHQMLVQKSFFNRELEPSFDNWYHRYNIERSIFSIVDIISEDIDVQFGNATKPKLQLIQKKLGDVVVMIDQFAKLLSLHFY